MKLRQADVVGKSKEIVNLGNDMGVLIQGIWSIDVVDLIEESII